MPVHLIVLNLTIVMIFGKVYNVRSSSLANFLQPYVTACTLGSNIPLSNLFSDPPTLLENW